MTRKISPVVVLMFLSSFLFESAKELSWDNGIRQVLLLTAARPAISKGKDREIPGLCLLRLLTCRGLRVKVPVEELDHLPIAETLLIRAVGRPDRAAAGQGNQLELLTVGDAL